MSDLITAARPYAKAVFETAQAEAGEAAWSEVLQLMSAVVAHVEMKSAVDSPRIKAVDKGELFVAACGDNLSATQTNLVKLLAENNRLALIPEIYELYEILRAEAESKIEAQVTSAYPLTDAQQSAISAALQKKLGCEVSLVTDIDKTLIGGVIIKAGDLVIDGSARARLESLAQVLTH